MSPHSLTVFNLLCGLFCLTIPGLLLMLTIYYCCQNRNSAWGKNVRIPSTKCLVIWITIGFILTFFVLAVIELLYALVYVAPQVYGDYGNWTSSQCEGEVFLTTFWVLNVSGIVVVILVATVGIYLSVLYFRWITNPDKPAALEDLIRTFLHKSSYSVQNK